MTDEHTGDEGVAGTGIDARPAIRQLVLRVGPIDAPGGEPDGEPPAMADASALYRLVDGRMPICARHLTELGRFRPGIEARVVLTVDQIDALVAEFGLRRDDLMSLHGAQDPILGPETCRMCETTHVEGNACYHDDCRKPLHPQWPAVYCSNACAQDDA